MTRLLLLAALAVEGAALLILIAALLRRGLGRKKRNAPVKLTRR